MNKKLFLIFGMFLLAGSFINASNNFSINSSTGELFFVDGTNGYIGIGTDIPQNLLNILGDVNITGTLYAGTFNPTNLSVANNLSVSGNALFVDNMTGNVGIGTTSPQTKLHVNGTLLVNDTIYAQGTKNLSIGYDYALNSSSGSTNWNANYSDYLQVKNYALNDSLWTLNYSNMSIGWLYATNSTGGLDWATAYNGTLAKTDASNTFGDFNQTFDTNTLFIDAVSGKVGIGTTSPGAKLHVSEGSSGATAHVYTKFLVEGSSHIAMQTLTPNDKTVYWMWGDPENNYIAGFEYNHATNVMGFKSNGLFGLSVKGTKVRVGDLAEADNTLSVSGNADITGNVGIGTTSPQSALHVNGSAVVNGSINIDSNNMTSVNCIVFDSGGQICSGA